MTDPTTTPTPTETRQDGAAFGLPPRKPYPTDLYPGCPCAACDHRNVMNLCPTCGNKRCPAAMDHARWACTGSNEPGQARTPIAPTPPTVSAPDVAAIRARVEAATEDAVSEVGTVLRDAAVKVRFGEVEPGDYVPLSAALAALDRFADTASGHTRAALAAAHAENKMLTDDIWQAAQMQREVEDERDEARAALAACARGCVMCGSALAALAAAPSETEEGPDE